MRKTDVERKREERKRKSYAGLIQVCVWIKPTRKEQLQQYAEGLNK